MNTQQQNKTHRPSKRDKGKDQERQHGFNEKADLYFIKFTKVETFFPRPLHLNQVEEQIVKVEEK